MIIINKEQSSVNEWFAACECSEEQLVGIKRIDTEDTIIFIQNEDYEKANKFVNSNKIPQLEDAVDVLGNVDSFDIRDIDWVDGNDVWGTKGIPHAHTKKGKLHFHEDDDGIYAVEHYQGRKGYPSFLFKMWE